MPKRNRVKIISTESVQGKGSSITLRGMSYGAIRAAQQMNMDGESSADEVVAYDQQLFEDLILDWNWVDDDGDPLPTPRNGLDIRQLTMEEYNLISDHLAEGVGKKVDEKN